MSEFPPLGHVAMTVRSCDASRPWYSALFGNEPVLDVQTAEGRHVIWALPRGTFFSIFEHRPELPHGDESADLRPGLDHASFHCRRRLDLEEWRRQLDSLGYVREDIVDAPYGSGLSFPDPDGNRLEFFAMPGA